MFPAETRRVLERLREAFRQAGRGSMARVARELGLHESFYSKKWDRKEMGKRLDVGVLAATLRELDISLPAFFAELEGSGGGLWGPAPLRECSTPATHAAVRRAYRRMRDELAGVDLVAELEGGDVEDVSATGPPLGEEWLAALDARRQEEPEAVAAEVAAGLDRVEAALLPRALGVWCSALRLALELEVAAYLNRWAVRLAEAAGDSAAVADLYVRRSYVAADHGDYRSALILTELGAGIFARLVDPAGEGRALVDCGRWLLYLDRHRESVAAHGRALELLPDSLTGNRFGALQAVGLVHLRLGDTDTAERCADLAAPLASCAGRQVKLAWLRARISRQRGRLKESEAIFRGVVEVFMGLHHGEATLASLELVEVLLGQGKTAEAWQVCLGMFPLEEKSPLISAAVGKLIRAGVSGLRLGRVRRVRRELEDLKESAKARREWRALAVAR